MDISARPPGTARRCRRTSRPPRSPWRGRGRCWTRSATRGRGVRSSPSSRHHSPRCSVRCTPPRARPEGLACFRSRRRRDPRARDRRPPGRAPPSSHAVRSGLPCHATSRRAGVRARAKRWRTVRCRGAGCGTVFSLCGSCWRGQAYCGARCRAVAQRRQRRRATARHQRSLEGRLDHRDRQRAYRARRRCRVTDAPSPRPPRSTTIALPVGHAALRPVCLVCGRVWAKRAAWRGPPARSGVAERRKAPDDGNS